MKNDVKCPYCGNYQQINHDDGYGYEEDETHQQNCQSCDKVFVYTTSILYCYDAAKADCLNGANHKYTLSNTHPKEWSQMICEGCNDGRELTNDERVIHGVGSKQDYFDSKQIKK